MTKLTSERSEKYRLQSETEAKVHSNQEIGLERVRILETELVKQGEYFKMQERGFQDRIDSLEQQIVREKGINKKKDE